MTVFGTTPGSLDPVSMSDAEAVSAEFIHRVNLYGGRDAYCADFGFDRRNFNKYMKGRIPDTPTLLMHLRNLEVPADEFFAAVVARTQP